MNTSDLTIFCFLQLFLLSIAAGTLSLNHIVLPVKQRMWIALQPTNSLQISYKIWICACHLLEGSRCWKRILLATWKSVYPVAIDPRHQKRESTFSACQQCCESILQSYFPLQTYFQIATFQLFHELLKEKAFGGCKGEKSILQPSEINLSPCLAFLWLPLVLTPAFRYLPLPDL